MNVIPAMQNWYEQNVAVAPKAKSTGTPPFRPKKPVEYLEITPIDRLAMDCLQKCSLPPGTSAKRFVRQFGRLTRLSDGGRRFLWFLAYRFRGQIKDREVVREAHRRHQVTDYTTKGAQP